MLDALPFLVIAATIGLWLWFEEREAERRRTAPERARRATRHLELDCYAHWGMEDHLRRILIGDLRAVLGRERARAWIRDEFGIDV